MENSIEKYRRAKKWSMAKLGEEIGTDASTINKIEKGKIKAGDRIIAISAALGASVEDLMRPPHESPSIVAIAGPQKTGGTERQLPQTLIPVVGTTAGSLLQGAVQIVDGVIEYIEPPSTLANSTGIYGLYIDGMSMEPMFRHGTKIVVSEYRPPRIGDAVVVQERRSEHSPVLASVGILETRTSETITLRKLNPPGTIQLQTRYVTAVHKVIDYSELLGS